jgi:hypothetical protein
MASSKERLRWERQFSAVTERMNRQRDMLSRAMAMMTEANAALLEIGTGDDLGPDQSNETVEYLRQRAREATARIADPSAALPGAVAESDQQYDDDMKEATDG